MATLRKSEAALSGTEWDAFIGAVNATHGMGIPAPRYRDFVQLHVRAMTTASGMSWSVHSVPGMGMIGRNFLAWHRRFILRLEQRLQQVDPSVSIPYWDWIANPRLPPALDTPALLRTWGVTRDWSPNFLPHAADIAAADARTDFAAFQRVLEQIHGGVHNAVGGTMAGATSPSTRSSFSTTQTSTGSGRSGSSSQRARSRPSRTRRSSPRRSSVSRLRASSLSVRSATATGREQAAAANATATVTGRR